MRSLLLLSLVLAVVVGSVGMTPAEEPTKIRVLLTTGGHGFQAEPFFAMFDSMDDLDITRAELPKQIDLLAPGAKKKFDCIVRYDMLKQCTPEQTEAFEALLAQGVGLVSLHHNLGAHADWDGYRKIMGGKFIFQPCTLDGKQVPKSTWSHGEDMNVTIADADHPITKGLADFTIHDETYGNYFTAPDVRVLLRTDHPKNDPELAWVMPSSKSRVFFLMLGHDGKAYADVNFQTILHRGIQWTAGRLE